MSEGSAARRLIVNADDFGLTAGVSRGILRAHREGLVTSTTVLASLPAQPELDATATASPGLGLGLHFNLTWGRPVSPGGDGRVPRRRGGAIRTRPGGPAGAGAPGRGAARVRGPDRGVRAPLRAGAHPPRQPPPCPPAVPGDGRRRRRGHGRAGPAAQPGRGFPRRSAPPRHRHDGLVRRRRASRALLDDRAPARPARHAAARAHRADVPPGRLRRGTSPTAATGASARSSWRRSATPRRARPSSASTSGSATSARSHAAG